MIIIANFSPFEEKIKVLDRLIRSSFLNLNSESISNESLHSVSYATEISSGKCRSLSITHDDYNPMFF